MADQTANTVKIAIGVLDLAVNIMGQLPALKELATTEDRERLEALEKLYDERSNAVADRLRATADDAV